MSKTLDEWLNEDVAPVKESSVRWLSEIYFHRDPYRASYVDPDVFMSPADGIVLYQDVIDADESVDFKGAQYTVKQILGDEDFDKRCLVIGIFLTFYDAHIQRIPYSGQLRYELLEPIKSQNRPMLDVEKWIVDAIDLKPESTSYMANNQRMVNTIYSSALDLEYFVVQIADYDIDCITPFNLEQNAAVQQGQRFSQIRYGSQVDLVLPLSDDFDYALLQETLCHVEAGVDSLVAIKDKDETLADSVTA